MASRSPPAPLKPVPPGAVVAYVARNQRPWRTKPHAHQGYELLYVSQGEKHFLCNGVEHHARAGDLIVFRPGDVHEEWGVSKQVSRMVIRCNARDLSTAQAAFPSTDKLGPLIRLPWRRRFQDLFARMAQERTHPKAHADMLLGAYLVEFVVLLARAADAADASPRDDGDAAGSSPGRRIRSTLELIQSNIDTTLPLAELARSAFMSPSHFSHVFRQEAGVAPKSYVISARIDRAKQLLATTALTAQQVAQRLGYDNPYYFYRLFRKKTGQTTSQFVRGARKCIPKRGNGHSARER